MHESFFSQAIANVRGLWAQISAFVGSLTKKWPCPSGVGAKIAPHFVITGLFGSPNCTSNAL
ncbi:MAG: hypothetical protein AXW14_13935 [Alteromonas sp. Nap_26]|nr:MAG: hypothetical protein AXW14_13935 [Alteromonas sp. Nap_26]